MNVQLLEYALKHLQRSHLKNLFVFFVLTFMTMLLAATLFISNSMKHELNLTLDTLPDIIVQNKKGGMHTTIDENIALEILEIPGVESAQGRVWGYYYFDKAEVYFSLLGVDEFEEQKRVLLDAIVSKKSIAHSSMLVGEGVLDILQKSYYKEYFNFLTSTGEIKKVFIEGVFPLGTTLESNDMIVMQKDTLRDIFGYKIGEATDIAVYVTNSLELPTVALKITQKYPNCKVITKEDLRISYENIFNYKNGLFLGLFVIAIFTFFIIVYDKLNGLSSAEKREIGILKAVGWRVEDVIKAKLYESSILSVFAYLLGILFAFGFVYILDAPLLRDIFIGYSDIKPRFELLFVIDFQTLFLLFFLSVPIYILATIIPAWRVATLDVDEVLR